MMLVTILMVKDEVDIIAACLCDRLQKFDLVAIVDSSTDGTSAICKDVQNRYPDRVLYAWDNTPFSEKYYRGFLYNMLKDHGVTDNDWIWQLDTDIFFEGDKSAIIEANEKADSQGANCIICKIRQFYLTYEDIKQKTHWKDFKYHSINWQSKIIYKGLSTLYLKGASQETPTIPNEKKATFTLLVNHYQYRSVDQIKKKVPRAFASPGYAHIITDDYKYYIIDSEFLSKLGDDKHRRPHHSWRSLVSLTKEKNYAKK